MISVRLILLFSLAAASSGCVSLHVTHPVRVTVMDAKTRKPVADVSVSTWFRYILVLNAPRDRMAKTDQNGEAVIPISSPSWWGMKKSKLYVSGNDRREFFPDYPFSSVAIPSDVIFGEHYSLMLEPSSWFAYYKQREMTRRDRGSGGTP